MSGSQRFSRNFRRKVLSNFLRMSNVCEGISSDYKNLFGFLGDKFSEPVHTIISLGCRQLGNCTFLIGLPGTVSNGLNARQSEIFTKMPQTFKRIRFLLRNVKWFQKSLFFLLLDKFSGSLIRSVEFPSVDNRAILWYAQAQRICPLKN